MRARIEGVSQIVSPRDRRSWGILRSRSSATRKPDGPSDLYTQPGVHETEAATRVR